MNNTIMTPENIAKAEDAQRNVARMAAQDAELVAVAAMAFADGLQIGAARAQANEK